MRWHDALTASTFSGNSATVGGGIANNDGTVRVTASTLSENSAVAYGGGISNRGGTLRVTASTLSGNSAGVGGGGIENHSPARLNNTIVANSIGGDLFKPARTT